MAATRKKTQRKKSPRAGGSRSRQPRNSNGQFARTSETGDRPRQEYERMRAREGYDEPRRVLARGEWEDERRRYTPEYGYEAQHRGGHLPRYESEREHYGREREPYARDWREARGGDERDYGRGRDEGRRHAREPEPYDRREKEWRAREAFDERNRRRQPYGREPGWVDRYEPSFERTARERREMREPERWRQDEEWRPREIPSEDEPSRRARELLLNDELRFRRREEAMNEEPHLNDRDTELNEEWWDERESRMNEDTEEKWNGSANGRW
jgi:hypothetical protein